MKDQRNQKKRDALYYILTIGLCLFLIYIIIQMVMTLLGHSWEISEFATALLVGLTLNSIRYERSFSEFRGEMREFKNNAISNLKRLNEKILEKL